MILQLNVFGEIISGKNFECDDLYVYYSLDLPDSKPAVDLGDFSSLAVNGYTVDSFRLVCGIGNDLLGLYSHGKCNHSQSTRKERLD